MSKLDIAVGEEFPLDEGRYEPRRSGRHRRHHFRHHAMHHRHHGGRRFGRFAILLVIAGFAALIVEHKLPAEAAYVMIATGLAGMVTMIVLHRRRHRRIGEVS